MVYDGADGHYQIVEKFFPPGNGGNILITSRNLGLERITLDSMKISTMREGEAVSLLLKSAKLDDTSSHISNLARKLALELDGIPLAIDQAGAYMQSTQCDIADYLELFTKHKHELMSAPEFKGASDYDTTTYGTWDISMQRIECMAAMESGQEALAAQSAIRIMRILAFLYHANVPEALFKNAADNYVKRDVDEEQNANVPLSVKLLDHETLFLDQKGDWEKMTFLKGIQVLLSFSFIEVHNKLYSMHALVHCWNRNRIPKSEIKLYQKARALLSCSVVNDYHFDNYAFCKLLAPHVRSNILYASELELESTYCDDDYEKFAVVFHHIGSWNEMEKMLLATAKWRGNMLGSDHPSTLSSMANLAYAYWLQGRWDEAEKLEVEVMNAGKAKLGSDHPSTLTSTGNLASTYRNQGRWDEAEKLEMEVMNARKAKLGSDHPSTITSMANLASTYWNQGRWDEAEKLFVEVMNASKAKLGSDHPSTLTSMANLASTYWNQGRWDEAEKLFVEVMNASKAKHGSDHPVTLSNMGNLASTYRSQGRWDEAEKLEVEVMNASKAKLGSDHPVTLSNMGNLASTYRNQGRWDEAEKLEVEVMNASKAKLGSDHPVTLTSMANLAFTYWSLGRWDEAESLLSSTVNTMKEVKGSQHPEVLDLMAQLDIMYRTKPTNMVVHH